MPNTHFFDNIVVNRLWSRWERLMFPGVLAPSRLWMWWVLPLLATFGALLLWTWPTQPAFHGLAARVNTGEDSKSELVARLSRRPDAERFPELVEVRIVANGRATTVPMRLSAIDLATVSARLGPAGTEALVRGSDPGGAWFIGVCSEERRCALISHGLFPIVALGSKTSVLDFLPHTRTEVKSGT